jgi:hypothetical protein
VRSTRRASWESESGRLRLSPSRLNFVGPPFIIYRSFKLSCFQRAVARIFHISRATSGNDRTRDKRISQSLSRNRQSVPEPHPGGTERSLASTTEYQQMRYFRRPPSAGHCIIRRGSSTDFEAYRSIPVWMMRCVDKLTAMTSEPDYDLLEQRFLERFTDPVNELFLDPDKGGDTYLWLSHTPWATESAVEELFAGELSEAAMEELSERLNSIAPDWLDRLES